MQICRRILFTEPIESGKCTIECNAKDNLANSYNVEPNICHKCFGLQTIQSVVDRCCVHHVFFDDFFTS